MKWMQMILPTIVAVGLSWGPGEAPVRVGTFDSRALAVAYAPSAQFAAWLMQLRESGDEVLAKARQARLHKQAFSTAPVDDILEEIAGNLPGVAEKAGVDVIVNRWRIAYQADGVELVDVTDLMVQLFEPSEKTLKSVAGIRQQEPLPLFDTDWEALENH